jgi:hypothetical protein
MNESGVFVWFAVVVVVVVLLLLLLAPKKKEVQFQSFKMGPTKTLSHSDERVIVATCGSLFLLYREHDHLRLNVDTRRIV